MTDLTEAQKRTAMPSLEKLLDWMQKSGRRWLIFNSDHFLKSLPAYPKGGEDFQLFIESYRNYRRTLPTGETEMFEGQEVPICYPETLTKVELDRCIRDLVGQITDMDPTWSLNQEPL